MRSNSSRSRMAGAGSLHRNCSKKPNRFTASCAPSFALDSGTQRQQAHKFYFREQMPITAFHFSKKLK